MQARPRLSIVSPAYNEEDRIRDSLTGVVSFFGAPAGIRGPVEILVVDDGSTDRTSEVVETFASQRLAGGLVVRLLRNGVNRGKGYSIKHGVLMAEGEYVLLSDADFSTPIEELPRLLSPVETAACEIAIGSRGLAESRVEIHQPIWREMMGRCFNRLVRALTGLPFRDTQCGFKVMRRETVLPLFRTARVERFAYDVELLYLARAAGVGVLEMPVIWRNAEGSKVNAVTDSFAMLRDIVWVVLRGRRGAYGRLDRRPDGGRTTGVGLEGP